MSDSANLAFPLCDCVVSAQVFGADGWYTCAHDFNYSMKLVGEYNHVLAQLVKFDQDAAALEAAALKEHNSRSNAPVAVAASVAAPQTVTAPKAVAPKPAAPVRVKPKRDTPKLTPQQTLLSVAGGLIVIALSVFFGTTWKNLDFLQQSGVLLAVVGLSAWGSVITKKYFAIISNFTAAISSLFLGAGLWVLTKTPDPATSPILALVLLALTAFGWILGRRFKIFGWLFTVPIAFVTSLLVFSQGYLDQLLQSTLGTSETFHQDAATLRTLLVSFGILAAFVLGRSTVLDMPAREQKALRFGYRLSALALVIYTGIQFGNLFSSFFSGWRLPNVVLLALLAAFWVTVSALTAGRLSALVSDAGKFADRLRTVLWYYSAALVGATVLDIQAQIHNPMGYMLTSIPLAAIWLFLPVKRIAQQHPALRGALNFASYAIWLFSALIFAVSEDAGQANVWTTWLALLALVHGAKAWTDKKLSFAHAFAVLAAAALIQLLATATQVESVASIAVMASALVAFVLHQILIKRVGAAVDLLVRLWHPAVSAVLLLLQWSVAKSSFEMIWISLGYTLANFALAFTARYRKDLEATLVATSGLSALIGYAYLSKTSWGTILQLQTVVGLYSLFIFAMAVFYASRTKFALAGILSFVPLGILTFMISNIEASTLHGTNWRSPLVPTVAALIGFLAVEKYSKTKSAIYSIMSVAVIALVNANFVYLLLNDESDRTLLSATLIAAGFALMHIPFLRVIRTKSKRLMTRTVALGTSVVATVASLTVSLAGQPSAGAGQLWLIAGTAAVSTTVAYLALTAKSEEVIARPWSAAALLGSIFTVSAFANALFANVISGYNPELALGLHLPFVLLATALLSRRIMLAAKRQDAEFAWAVRPASVLIAGLLTMVSWNTLGRFGQELYFDTFLNTTSTLVSAAAFLIAGAVFSYYRIREHADHDASRSAVASQLITFGFGAWILSFTQQPEPGINVGLLGAWALMNVLVSWSQRDRFTGVLAFLFGYVSLLSGAGLICADYEIKSLAMFSFAAIASFVLANVLVTRASGNTNVAWGLALPVATVVSYGYGLYVGSFSNVIGTGWTEFLIADLTALLYVAVATTTKLRVFGPSRAAIAAAAIINWSFATILAMGNILLFKVSDTSVLQMSTLFATIWLAVILVLRQNKLVVTLVGAYLALALSASNLADAINMHVSILVPEITFGLIALSVLINSLVAKQLGMFRERIRSLMVWAFPILMFTVGSTLVAWGYVAAPITSLAAPDALRLALLLVGSGLLLVLGLRIGNRGLAVAGIVTFALNLLPQIWFRIDEFMASEFAVETKFIYVAALIYAALVGLQNVLKWKVSSLVTIGLPVLFGMAPALFDTVGALDRVTLTTEDWVRFAIVLVASMLMLVVGALRKLGGLFFPGVFGVAVAVLPYLWTPLSKEVWLLWAVLIAAAGLLVWVAIRLEQFKTGVKSASAWMRELK